MGNTFGHLFRVTTWGESHGAAIGAVIDGCPPLLPLSEADIQPDLDRRAPGQSALVTQRKESDTVRILSGVFEGKTLGTPDRASPSPTRTCGPATTARSSRSTGRAMPTTPTRPSTGSATGGAAAARARARRRAASPPGAIARKLLALRHGVEIVAWVAKVGAILVECDVGRRDPRPGRRDAHPLSRAATRPRG